LRITFKLFATLRDYLPPEREGDEVVLEVPEGTPIQAIVDRYRLPRSMVHLVLVNGLYVPPGQRAAHRLRDGDALAIWPPIAGG
jgi:sulfur carrier protein ThiS